jgi:hypothetical protein
MSITSILSTDSGATSLTVINGNFNDLDTTKADTLAGTINEITYFNSATTVASLPVATYPSLTELSYVKGVTGALQSQINAKGVGTVTAVSVATANGVSGSSSGGATPALTLTLGAITPSTVNGNTITTGTGTITITGTKTLTVSNTADVSGTNTGDNAANSSSTYIGTTQVALNRASNALTLAGITLTTPDIGTPSAGTLTNCTGYAADINLPKGKQINLTLPDTDATCTGPVTASFAAGYSSAVGDLVFFGTGGKWLEVDADAVATCVGLMGIALEAKTDGQAMKVALPGSMVHIDAWNLTVGAVQYAGETLGAIQEAIPTGADAIVRVVGFALDADTLFFNPSSDQQSTVA